MASHTRAEVHRRLTASKDLICGLLAQRKTYAYICNVLRNLPDDSRRITISPNRLLAECVLWRVNPHVKKVERQFILRHCDKYRLDTKQIDIFVRRPIREADIARWTRDEQLSTDQLQALRFEDQWYNLRDVFITPRDDCLKHKTRLDIVLQNQDQDPQNLSDEKKVLYLSQISVSHIRAHRSRCNSATFPMQPLDGNVEIRPYRAAIDELIHQGSMLRAGDAEVVQWLSQLLLRMRLSHHVLITALLYIFAMRLRPNGPCDVSLQVELTAAMQVANTRIDRFVYSQSSWAFVSHLSENVIRHAGSALASVSCEISQTDCNHWYSIVGKVAHTYSNFAPAARDDQLTRGRKRCLLPTGRRPRIDGEVSTQRGCLLERLRRNVSDRGPPEPSLHSIDKRTADYDRFARVLASNVHSHPKSDGSCPVGIPLPGMDFGGDLTNSSAARSSGFPCTQHDSTVPINTDDSMTYNLQAGLTMLPSEIDTFPSTFPLHLDCQDIGSSTYTADLTQDQDSSHMQYVDMNEADGQTFVSGPISVIGPLFGPNSDPYGAHQACIRLLRLDGFDLEADFNECPDIFAGLAEPEQS